MKIIVSRYNEEISWTKEFSNVIIYNKGKTLNGEYNEIEIKNVGRESHTYFKYIYDNYNNLDDYTIFLQGNPFDHSPNIIKNLKKYTTENIELKFEFLSEKIIECSLNGCRYHPGLPLREYYKYIFGNEGDNSVFSFGAGAQFIVSKTQILKHPKDFYLKILKTVDNHICPIEAYILERFYKLIFFTLIPLI
jgi:hypothetical protein